MRYVVIFLTLFVLAIPPAANAENLRGVVVKVLDGDTFDVKIGFKTERVRVYGINAAEKSDPMGPAAKQFAKDELLGKPVKLSTRGRGTYKRLLAFVRYGAQYRKSFGLELVRKGLAVVYSNRFKPANDDTYERYQDAQIGAMAADLGIWGKRGRGVKK